MPISNMHESALPNKGEPQQVVVKTWPISPKVRLQYDGRWSLLLGYYSGPSCALRGAGRTDWGGVVVSTPADPQGPVLTLERLKPALGLNGNVERVRMGSRQVSSGLVARPKGSNARAWPAKWWRV